MAKDLVSALRGIAGARASLGNAALSRREAHIPVGAKFELRALKASQANALKQLIQSNKAQLDAFLAQYAGPKGVSPKQLKEVREVVAKFAIGQPAEAGGVRSDGTTLYINDVNVATRNNVTSQTKVCPGEFGTDAEARSAANGLLAILGTGLRVRDRDGAAFVGPKNKTGRALANQCYTVQLSPGIIKRSAQASKRKQEDVFGVIDVFGRTVPKKEAARNKRKLATAEKRAKELDRREKIKAKAAAKRDAKALAKARKAGADAGVFVF